MNVFITGGTGGIGAAVAVCYLEQGHRVGVCGGTEDDFQRAFPVKSEHLEFFDLDVTDRQACIDIIQTFSNGSLGVLVAGAGVNDGAPVKGKPLDFDRANLIFNVNLIGTLNTIEAGLPVMLAQGHGAIAVISSAAALNGFGETPAYCASKAAVTTMCESLSLRYSDKNITVSALMPGFIDTPLARATHPNLEKMPFMINADKAANMIVKAIAKKKMRYIFPWQVHLVSSAFSAMPRPWFKMLFKWSEK